VSHARRGAGNTAFEAVATGPPWQGLPSWRLQLVRSHGLDMRASTMTNTSYVLHGLGLSNPALYPKLPLG
jgi:hypothetical protein